MEIVIICPPRKFHLNSRHVLFVRVRLIAPTSPINPMNDAKTPYLGASKNRHPRLHVCYQRCQWYVLPSPKTRGLPSKRPLFGTAGRHLLFAGLLHSGCRLCFGGHFRCRPSASGILQIFVCNACCFLHRPTYRSTYDSINI